MMYKHILIPTDGSELADMAVRHGLEFAKTIGAEITVLTVSAPYHVFTANIQMLEDTSDTYIQRIQQAGEAVLGKAAIVAKAVGVKCDTVRVEHEHPYEAIINFAQARGCDLIVMASHGRRGTKAILIGSETLRVLTHSKIPVLVYR